MKVATSRLGILMFVRTATLAGLLVLVPMRQGADAQENSKAGAENVPAELIELRTAYEAQIRSTFVPQQRRYHQELLKLERELAGSRDYESAIFVKKERELLEARLGDALNGALPEVGTLPGTLESGADIVLAAGSATAVGKGVEIDLAAGTAGKFTDNSSAAVWKLFRPLEPGGYEVVVEYACSSAGGGGFRIEEPFYYLRGQAKTTGGWGIFTTEHLGTLRVRERTETIRVSATEPAAIGVMVLKSIRLIPASQEGEALKASKATPPDA